MNYQETIELWEKCQDVKAKFLAKNPEQEVDAQELAAKIWNKWSDAVSESSSNEERTTTFFQHRFETIADFSNFRFPGVIYLNEAQFVKEATFLNCTFKGEARFDLCSFLDTVKFGGTVFELYTNFIASEFHRKVLFDDVIFKFGRQQSKNNETSTESNFTNASVDFGEAHFKGLASFRRIKFRQMADFAGASFEGVTFFSNCSFEDIPNFVQTNFTSVPIFDLDTTWFNDRDRGIVVGFFKSIFGKTSPGQTERFVALKKMAIDNYDVRSEMLFWSGELRSLRSLDSKNQTRPPWSIWCFNLLYGITANSGRSVIRPLIFLIASIIFMATYYIGHSRELICSNALQLLELALHNTFSFLNLLNENEISAKYALIHTHNGMFYVEFFHKVLSLIFLFLFFLGLRNNLRIK